MLGDYLGREVGVKLEASRSRPCSARMGHHVGTKLETELGMRPKRRRVTETMKDLTALLAAPEHVDAHAAEQLLPLVYDELRKPAVAKLAREKTGQTLQATAPVHEAYVRLVGAGKAQHWDNRRRFFAAAEALRRILVENARRLRRAKHGGVSEGLIWMVPP